jgi:hypothetical protein
MKDFRRGLKKDYDIKLSDELKANSLIRKRSFALRLDLDEKERIEIYRKSLEFLGNLGTIKIFSVCIRKKDITSSKLDIFSFAWKILFTRLHYTTNRLNEEIGRHDKSMVISDQTEEAKIRKILRQLRVINYIKDKNVPLDTFVEDPFIRNSKNSYFVQFCDLVAFSVAAKNLSSKLTDPYRFGEMYNLLEPVLEKSVYSRGTSEGIVYFPVETKIPAEAGTKN